MSYIYLALLYYAKYHWYLFNVCLPIRLHTLHCIILYITLYYRCLVYTCLVYTCLGYTFLPPSCIFFFPDSLTVAQTGLELTGQPKLKVFTVLFLSLLSSRFTGIDHHSLVLVFDDICHTSSPSALIYLVPLIALLEFTSQHYRYIQNLSITALLLIGCQTLPFLFVLRQVFMQSWNRSPHRPGYPQTLPPEYWD